AQTNPEQSGSSANERTMRPLGPYTIEPPDVLQIDVVRAIPKEPARVEPLGKVRIEVEGTAVGQPIDGDFKVDSTGSVVLGPIYGAVNLRGMTRVEAEEAVTRHLRTVLKDPAVSLTIDESPLTKGVEGKHLVGPDGTVTLG